MTQTNTTQTSSETQPDVIIYKDHGLWFAYFAKDDETGDLFESEAQARKAGQHYANTGLIVVFEAAALS